MADTVWNSADKNAGVTLTNSDLTAEVPANVGVRSTNGKSTGKHYVEFTLNTAPSSGHEIGIANSSLSLSVNASSSANAWVQYGGGQKANNNSYQAYGSAPAAGNIVMMALDMDNGKVWWGINGTWQASGDPAAGTNAAYTGLTGTMMCVASNSSASACKWTGNWGASAFSYTPPSGFSAWNGAAGQPAVKRMGGVPFASPNRGVW